MARAFEKYLARLNVVEEVLATYSPRTQGEIEDDAERETAVMFDRNFRSIHPRVDMVRRVLFKLSCLKTVLEYRGGGPRNDPELAHRWRLIAQPFLDYLLMMMDGEFPPPQFLAR